MAAEDAQAQSNQRETGQEATGRTWISNIPEPVLVGSTEGRPFSQGVLPQRTTSKAPTEGSAQWGHVRK